MNDVMHLCITYAMYSSSLSSCRKGSFLVRPSERTPGDYALAFRTNTDIRHWRIVNKSNKFYVHPRPNPYNSLDDIIAVSRLVLVVHIGMQLKIKTNP